MDGTLVKALCMCNGLSVQIACLYVCRSMIMVLINAQYVRPVIWDNCTCHDMVLIDVQLYIRF